MSFRCQVCRKPQETHAVPQRVVTKKRVREYVNRRTNAVTRGWEIVEEKVSCSPCAAGAPEAVLVEDIKRAPVFTAPLGELEEMDFGDQGEDRRERRVARGGMGR